MTVSELRSLFGHRLQSRDSRPAAGYQAYTAYSLSEKLCGVPMDVDFVFVPGRHGDRLLAVQLSGQGASGTNTIDCILKRYATLYGKPRTSVTGSQVQHAFALNNTTVDILVSESLKSMVITYGVREEYFDPPGLDQIRKRRR